MFKAFEKQRIGRFRITFQEAGGEYAVEPASALMKASKSEMYLFIEAAAARFIFRKLKLFASLHERGHPNVGCTGQKQRSRTPASIEIQ